MSGMKPSFALPFILVPSLAIAAFACGGSVDTTGQQRAGSTAGTAEQAQKEEAAPKTGSGASAPQPECKHSNQSGSGGGGGPGGAYSCTTTHEYSCTTGDRSITCDCTGKAGQWDPGTCTCSDTGVTFAYDCASACTLPDATFAKCNLPPPPPSPPSNGGSTTSSSGG